MRGRLVAVVAVVSALVCCGLAVADSGMLTQLAGVDGCINDTGAEGCAVGSHLAGARAVAVSPDGTSAYLATIGRNHQQGRGLIVFNRAPQTGALTQLAGKAGCFIGGGARGRCTAVPGWKGAYAVTVSPDGRNVYAGGIVFSRDLQTGALSVQQTIGDWGDLVVSPDGKNAYTSGHAYARDPATGALTNLPGHVAAGHAFAISADGQNVYVTGVRTGRYFARELLVYARDPATGELTQLPGKAGCLVSHFARRRAPNCNPVRGIADSHAITVSPDGTSVYAGGLFAMAAFHRDSQTGALTQLSGAAGTTGPGSVQSFSLTPDGTILYAVDRYSNRVAIFSRDPSTGALATLGGAGGRGLTQPYGLALSGSYLYVAARGWKSGTWPKTTSAVVVFARN